MEKSINISQLAHAINEIAKEYGECELYDIRRSLSVEHSRLIILFNEAESVSIPLLEDDFIKEEIDRLMKDEDKNTQDGIELAEEE